MESLSAISNLIPLVLIVLLAVFGYRLLKIKGHASWTYLLLIISSTPLFWFIFGLTKSKNPTPVTKLWSNVALLWGILSLILIVYSKETFQKKAKPTSRNAIDITWTTERIALLRKKYTNTLSQMGISSTSIDNVVDCVVGKTIDRFPDGLDLLKTTPYIDSVMNRIGRECGEIWFKDSDVMLKWTPEIENQLLMNLKKNMAELSLNAQQMDNIANCILKNLKAKYPNGMDSNNKSQGAWEEEMASLMSECYNNEL